MKIKERADTVIYEPKDGHAPIKAYEVIAYADGYERGATEQKQIDAEWLNNNAGKYVTMVDGQMHFDIHRMVTDFKRDMEE